MLQTDPRAVHAGLSPVDLRFRDFASNDPECLSRSTFAELDRKNPLFKYKLQSWPVFVDRSQIRELARVSTGVNSLIRSLPERVFGCDPKRIAHYFGIDDDFAHLLISPPNGIPGLLSRGDFIHTSKGFQVVEFNMTSNLGGWETGLLAGLLLRIPPIARFVRESGAPISSKNTVRLFMEHALRMARQDGLIDAGELNVLVGVLEPESVFADQVVLRYLQQEHAAVLREKAPELKGTIVMRNYLNLTVRGAGLYDGDRRLHSVLERHVDSTDGTVFRSFKQGGLHLYNGPVSWILSDKRNIALLSELGDSDVFDSQERKLIQNHVPWARRVLLGETLFEGERVQIEDLLRVQRERFVIKKARSLGGAHVLLGRFSSSKEWDAALAAAFASGDWIVQEYVESLPYLFQAGDHGCCPHDVVWGPFVFGDRYAGAILRVQPKAFEGIVNLTRGATEAIVLEVDDGTPEPF